MSADRDDNLDALLTDFLKSELDPQVGRVAQRLPTEPPGLNSTARLPWIRPTSPARTWWPFAAAGVGLAAALVAAVLAIADRPGSRDGLPPTPKPDVAAASPNGTEGGAGIAPCPKAATDDESPAVAVGEVVEWSIVDGGLTVDDDGAPVRRLVRRKWETTTWVDTRTGSRRETYVPSEEIVLVAVQTY